MNHNLYVYLGIMIVMTNLIRVLPILLIRGKIKNRFLRSFLYYVPYVTLAVMTFPAIIHSAISPWAGAAALVAGIVAAWRGWGLFPVAIICCLVAGVVGMICTFF